MTLLQEAQNGKFTDQLMDNILLCNEDKVILAALSRSDCPESLLIDFSFSPVTEIRLAVAGNKNTPLRTLSRLATDQDQNVSETAKKKLR